MSLCAQSRSGPQCSLPRRASTSSLRARRQRPRRRLARPSPTTGVFYFLQDCWYTSGNPITQLFSLALHLNSANLRCVLETNHLYILTDPFSPFPGFQMTPQNMIRPGLHRSIPQPFLTHQQHGPSTSSQPHNLDLHPSADQNTNVLQNPRSSNGSFPDSQLAGIQADSRRRDLHTQSQRATAGGAQTPPAVNGVLPAQPPGVGYSGMNGQVPAHRVVSQPGGPLPPSHPGSMSKPGLGLSGGLQTPRSVSRPQLQQKMGMRPGQPLLQGQRVGHIRQPPVGMPGIPSGTKMRGSGGMGVMAPGTIGNISQQTPPQ